MQKSIVIGIFLMLLSVGISPVVSSLNNNSTIEYVIEEKNSLNLGIGRYVYRFFLIGYIYGLDIDGDYYSFSAHKIRGLRHERYWSIPLNWSFDIIYFPGDVKHFFISGYKFFGIIEPDFICGCFHTTYWYKP